MREEKENGTALFYEKLAAAKGFIAREQRFCFYNLKACK